MQQIIAAVLMASDSASKPPSGYAGDILVAVVLPASNFQNITVTQTDWQQSPGEQVGTEVFHFCCSTL